MQKHSLKVLNRTQSNKGNLKRLRSAGKIPGNIYSKGNARAITVSAVAFRNLNKEIGGGASLVELEDENGETALTNIQSVQVNAVSRVIEHIDFREVARGESFVARVPVQLVGTSDCIGVKHDGGVIDHKSLELEIRCRPSKLPESISVDIAQLKVGEAIHVDDLEAIDGVEFLNNGVQVIVSCQPPTVAAASESVTADADGATSEEASGAEAGSASDSTEAGAVDGEGSGAASSSTVD
ncbi:MAG: 50S ribosomal protein L25 [Puniceicoccaceae bacterium]|nr:MAG: 50S ribosomal protein L25 [Puniceicoccaceae bacterium]